MNFNRRWEAPTTGGANTEVSGVESIQTAVPRLMSIPNKEHKPENYNDLQLEFQACSVFSPLESYMRPDMRGSSREDKIKIMREICCGLVPYGDLNRGQEHKDYRQKFYSYYPRLHKELYSSQPETFFVPTFYKAITDNTEESFRSILSEPYPGVFTCEMFQPHFCDLLMEEVENFVKWADELKLGIRRPNIMRGYGVILGDLGHEIESMLHKIMEKYIRQISQVCFHEVEGSTLDSHHSFVVEYGTDRDAKLGIHMDDSEVTLNACLGKQFTGGELFFRGVRCDKHVNTSARLEEIFEYSHVPGRAVFYRGRHRHGVRATTSGHRVNLLLWCRSSFFRFKKERQTEFPDWCGECYQEAIERKNLTCAAVRLEAKFGEQ